MAGMYTVREDPPEQVRESLKEYDPLSQRLLFARGITGQDDAALFFDRTWKETDPYRYRAMYEAAGRVLKAVRDGETIGIYSDYDCDGIPAAAALFSTLTALGHRSTAYYVPDRNTQGFGVHPDGVAQMLSAQASVVCILDCGTSSPDAVASLRRAGCDVIILDHHLPGERHPEPLALINPTVEEGIEEPHPCAAGVVFLFIQAIIRQAHETALPTKPPIGWERWQLDLIGLATLSDMVPLRNMNRQIARYGLEVFRKSPRPGVRALCNLLRIRQQAITQDDLAYLIIPRINAASRMGDARRAFRLLTASTIEDATTEAKALTRLNERRKTAVATMVREADTVAKGKDRDRDVWVFGNRLWKPSLAGLVAQRLSEKHGKTVFVWGQCDGQEGATIIKGSCRSRRHDIFSLMQKKENLFTESGGHRQAGGFTLTEGAEVILEEALNETPLTGSEEKDERFVDTVCRIKDVPSVLRVAETFAPFGVRNEHVSIALDNCRVQQTARFGKKRDHVRYTFADGDANIQGIAFFAGDTAERSPGTPCTVIGSVERDTLNSRPRIRVEDIVGPA